MHDLKFYDQVLSFTFDFDSFCLFEDQFDDIDYDTDDSFAKYFSLDLIRTGLDKFKAGEIEKSRNLQFKLNPLISALFCEVNPIPVKKAMSFLGYGNGIPRLPLTEMEEENANRLLGEMQKLALL